MLTIRYDTIEEFNEDSTAECDGLNSTRNEKQESCAIAKMTARCALYK